MSRAGSNDAPAASGSASRRIKNRKVTHLVGLVSASLERTGLRPGSTILIGLSGGPDSVALLDALDRLRPKLRYQLAAAHLNHRLRGAESDRDEAFVRNLCAQRGIDLRVGHAKGLSRSMPNLEERAREQRQRFLNRAADRIGADYIALAHHADDQAETFLMRLLRGAGAAGLGAMAETGPLRLIRPLLTARRAAIMDYLRAVGADWVIDSSNSSIDLLRNRIRLELLPTLERDYAPGLSHRLTQLADEMRGLDHLVTALAVTSLEQRIVGDRLSLTGYREIDPVLAPAILREYLRRRLGDLRRISRDHVTAIGALCRGDKPSGSIPLPNGWRARREYRFLAIERSIALAAGPFAIKLRCSGRNRLKASDFQFQASVFAATDSTCPAPNRLTMLEAVFDVAAVGDGLVARNLNPGDRIEPLGMRGTRKVQDVFVDCKLPRALRDRWPLVTSGGAVLWIPGMVRSRHAVVTPETTKIQYLRALPPPGWKETSVA